MKNEVRVSSDEILKKRRGQQAWQGGLINPITGYYMGPTRMNEPVLNQYTKIEQKATCFKSMHI